MTIAPVRPPARHRVEPAPRRRRSLRWLAGPAQLAAAVLVFHLAVLERQQGSATLVGLAFLLFVPGVLLLDALALRPARAAAQLVYTVGASIAFLLAVILAVRALAPVLDIARPLATYPMVVGVDVGLLILTVAAGFRRQLRAVPIPSRLPASSALLLIPVAVGMGAEMLENRNSLWLLVTSLLAAGTALVWSYFQARQGREGRVMLVIYSCALTLLWSYSLRSKGMYGFDIQQEFGAYQATAHSLAWNSVPGSAYSAMLSITALPTLLWQLTGLSGSSCFKLLFPALFALYPVGIYVLSRRWLRPVTALLCTSLLFLTASVASQLPALGRQEIGLLLFVAILVAAFDTSLRRLPAQALVLLLGLAMVVSHYSTAYVALGAFVAARLISLLLGLFRQRPSYRAVLGLPIVALLVAWSAYWTIGVTHSGQNVSQFAGTVSTSGAQVLPNAHQSLLVRALAGNLTAAVPPQTYFDSIDRTYALSHTWVKPYSAAQQKQFAAVASSAPTVRPWQPGIEMPWRIATTAVRQVTNLLIVAGTLSMVVLMRRRRLDPELVAMSLAMLLISLAVRISGSASFAYNPERLALQTAAVLVVPLGLVVQVLRRRLSLLYPAGRRLGIKADTPQRLAGTLGVALLALVFLDASGLGARAMGGVPPGNLATTGEYVERFRATDQDLAAARWMAGLNEPHLLIYADRYGGLILESQEATAGHGLLTDLAPGTIDRRAMVFASTSNIVNDRARGTTPDGLMSSTYAYPTAFLDANKAVVFDTGWTRIYQ